MAVGVLFLLLAGLVPLWLWSRDRALAREKSVMAAVEALRLLKDLQETYRQRNKIYFRGDVAGLLAASMPSPSVDMPPEWEQIYNADVRGKACPTSYGYLFEALPAKGFSFRAFPAKDDRLQTFVIGESGW